ncbi:MAG: hypothetical protein K6G90_10130 [Clostridia bacterium]|nr:hypothetical protein [Clostridia bacterium]
MKIILMSLLLLAAFVIGYFVIDRFGSLIDEGCSPSGKTHTADKTVYVIETEGKRTKTVSKDIISVLDTVPDRNEYDIIICDSADSDIIEYLEDSGYTVEYD